MHGGVESEEWELNMLSLDSMQWEAPQGLRMPAQVQQAGTVPIHRTKIFSFGYSCTLHVACICPPHGQHDTGWRSVIWLARECVCA